MNTSDIDELEKVYVQRWESKEGLRNYVRFLREHGAEGTAEEVWNETNAVFASMASTIENDKNLLSYLKQKSVELYVAIACNFKNLDNIRDLLEKRKEYGLNTRHIMKLTKATNDKEFIKAIIERHEEFDIDIYNIVSLAIATNDEKYIKSIIKRHEEFEFDLSCIKDLVREIKDKEFIKELIEKHEEYGFGTGSIVELAKMTNDTEYMKSIIGKFKRYGLDAYDIVNLAIATNDARYIKTTARKYEKYGFGTINIVDLAIATKDTEFIKELIEKNEEYGLFNWNIKRLAIATNDTDFIKKVIQEHEKYGLSQEAKLILLNEIGELENYLIENGKIKPAKEISLPEDMTIGIEIESEMGMKDFKKTIPKNWKQKSDRSLIEGIEIVSPILAGKTHSVEEIYKVCAILEATGHVTSKRCGGHVHIGADYLTSVEAYKNLMEIWANSESILYSISNKIGELSRNGVGEYAQPISKKIELALESGQVDLENENDLRQFVSEMSQIQEERYSGINFKNTLSNSKNTIEFRLSNGTIDPDTWVENINLYGGIIKAAQDLSIIQKKEISEQTEGDANKLRLLEVLKSENSSPEDKLEALLRLTIKEEQREIYRKRYRVNSKMLKEMPGKEQQISEMISDKTLTVNKVGKAVLTGENAITGEEYMSVENQMNALLARENEQAEQKIK